MKKYVYIPLISFSLLAASCSRTPIQRSTQMDDESNPQPAMTHNANNIFE